MVVEEIGIRVLELLTGEDDVDKELRHGKMNLEMRGGNGET